jgi:pyruvate,orthophosphate dikinase
MSDDPKVRHSIDPAHKLVYYWDEISAENEHLFGQKCARLAEAKRAGLPVPPFFAISMTGVRQIIHREGIDRNLNAQICVCLRWLEEETGCSFADPTRPLVAAVRSGDPFSMAGAMFSYLNVGINELTIPALIEQYKNELPFYQMYLDSIVDHAFVVEEQPHEDFSEILDGIDSLAGNEEQLLALIESARGKTPSFPEDANVHLIDAIIAVAMSWLNYATSAFREEMELNQDVFPSIFVQQAAFGSLANSGFLAFCTHNPVTGEHALHGDFALGTEGRRMMRGIGPERFPIGELGQHFPEIAKQIEEYSERIERHFRRPQDIEAIVERSELKLVQIVDAHLAARARRAIVADFRARGVIGEKENIPPVPWIRRTRVIKTYKLRPEVELVPIAQGVPTHPGAVGGRLALNVEDAIRLGVRRGDRTILIIKKPDERVLSVLLRRQVEGFATTYASTHDSAAAMLSHVPSVMSMKIQTEGDNYLIAPDGERIPAGKRMILDGTAGCLYVAPPFSEVALIEDKPILVTPHELISYEIEEQTRARYQDRDYGELLRAHAEHVARIKSYSGAAGARNMLEDDTIEYANLELITHFIHIMIYEKAAELGLSYADAQLDVAVEDGSLDRVPGLEHKRIALERRGDDILLVIGTEVSYEDEFIESMAYTREQLRRLQDQLTQDGIETRLFTEQKKLSRHTQFVLTTFLGFAERDLQRVVIRMRRLENSS